jgi:EAL domain-containing protein (putative c-di-GMP-specific phosphodiesterase class I)
MGVFDAEGFASGVLCAVPSTGHKVARPGPVLRPVFQPIISLHTGRTAGFEALARWTKGTDASFEDPALASNMLIHAAQALAVWHKATGRTDLFVQVNLTARDLATRDVANLIGELISGYGLPEGVIRVELTEQAALRDMDKALETVKAIKAAGATLVLDDFGSGHSSFAWLADMPADALKIDPSLTQRIGDPRTEHILEAITLLASRLHMSATAEGVEDKAMVGKLRQLGFTYVQGFAFSKPLEETRALKFLRAEE